MKIIDAWMQHPSKDMIESEIFAPLRRWMSGKDSGLLSEEQVPVELTLASMADVDVGLICAWYGPTGPLVTNEQVLETCRAHPKFRGVCSADIRTPSRAVAEVRKYITEHGFVGVRVLPWLWEKPCTDRLFYPIYQACVELNVPLCLQVGHTGPARPSEYGRPIPYLEQVLLDFPDLVVVGGHIGEPWLKEMLFLCTKFQNVYIDTSAYVPNRYPKELVEFIKGSGKHRVMFGTNYPMIPHPLAISQIDSLGLSDQVRDLFLWQNADRVFKLGKHASL